VSLMIDLQLLALLASLVLAMGWYPCCCAPCDTSGCAQTDGRCIDNLTPCQIQVELSGITDGDCADCDGDGIDPGLNTIFVVGNRFATGTGRCRYFLEFDPICGFNQIAVNLDKDNFGSGLIVSVTLTGTAPHGAINWIRTFSTPQSCTGFNGTVINFSSNSGSECGAGSSTATITAL
jgi:hypothetical protein